jgi:hypothetical protein
VAAIAFGIFVFAAAFGVSRLHSAQRGTLACSRAANRCDIDNGWLIRDHAEFPADQLRGAKVVWSRASNRMYTSGAKVYSVEVIAADGTHDLSGPRDDHKSQDKVAATIDAFAKDPNAPTTLDVRIAAETFDYVLVSMLCGIYGLVLVAMFAQLLRQRHFARRSTRAT